MLLHARLRVKPIINIIKVLFFFYNKLYKENACAMWPDALFPPFPDLSGLGGGPIWKTGSHAKIASIDLSNCNAAIAEAGPVVICPFLLGMLVPACLLPYISTVL
jgi:hypothetical protein